MALDTYQTKTAAVTAAGTYYPTGPISAGGGNVDELDMLGRLPISETFAVLAHVATGFPSGGTPALVVSVESDDTVAFSSPVERAKSGDITTAGKHLVGYIAGPMERYLRFKCVQTGAGSFGTVTVSLTKDVDTNFFP